MLTVEPIISFGFSGSGGRSPMLSKVVAGVPFFPIKLGEVPYNSKRWEESNFIPCNGRSPILSHVVV